MRFPNYLNKLSLSLLAPKTRLHNFLVRYRKYIDYLFITITIVIFPFFCLYSWLRIYFIKLLKIKPNVLWGPTPIINIAESSALMNSLGYKSRTLVYTVYFITNKFDCNMQVTLQNPAMSYWFPNVIFLWSTLFFDIYHFYYDGGLWSGMNIIPKIKWLELPFLRLAGKRIIASAYGADVRTFKRDQMWQPWNACKECPEKLKHCICDDFISARRIKYYRDWANKLLAMGDMHDYVYGSDQNFIYWPIDTDKNKYIGIKEHNKTICIAHSPNHRHFKGTKYIQNAVNNLKKKGYDIKLDIIEKVSNHDAKIRYSSADIIFAQCIIGWVGFTEIEAMAMGKPVITNIRDKERYLSKFDSWPPLNATPDNAELIIEQLINNYELRQDLSYQSRKHVEKFWSFKSCGPNYRLIHENVWQNSGLLEIIRKKYNDIRKGSLATRAGNIAKKNSLEYPIWVNPIEYIKRIEWGIYGRPIWDNAGILQVNISSRFTKHPGIIAFYCLNLFHLILRRPKSTFIKKFKIHTQWISEFILQNQHNDYKFDLDNSLEYPKWLNEFYSLSLSLLVRAKMIDTSYNYLPAISQLIILNTENSNNISSLKNSDNKVFFLPSRIEFTLENLPIILLWIFAIYDYHKLYLHKRINSLSSIFIQIKKLIYDANLNEIISLDYVNCDFKNDEYYFIIKGIESLSYIIRDNFFKKKSASLFWSLIKFKFIHFLNGKMPI